MDKGWRELLQEVRRQHGGTHAKVGVLDSTNARTDGSGITNAELALIHEFGSPDAGIPERSHFRSTFDANKGKYERQLTRAVGLVLDRKLSFEGALELVAIQHEADIKAAIARGIPPENAPSTIARKGSTKPLIDTGAYRASITHAVVRGTPEGGE